MTVELGLIVPGLPHPLLCPDASPGYRKLADAFDHARQEIDRINPDVLLVYSTMWPSVIGHQIQNHPRPTYTHVDELFHSLGSMPYAFQMHTAFGDAFLAQAQQRGLMARTVAYDEFPIDTGSVVALKLLDPEGKRKASIVSSNMYADRAETVVLAKAATDALKQQGLNAVAIMVMTLSNRLFTDWIDPAEDRVHSAKDDEWNQKLLELLGEGRLEDVAQLSRTIQEQVRVPKVVNFKPMWFLSALMGAHNLYDGKVLAYEGVHGTGSAVVSLRPSKAGTVREYDEDDVEVWRGNHEVLQAPTTPVTEAPPIPATPPPAAPAAAADPARVDVAASKAPNPVGAYPHARRVGNMLYLSGCGPRQPETNEIPGGPIRDAEGNPLDYDIRAQTQAVIDNIAAILEASGSSLDHIVDVLAFLVDMDRDFKGYNEVYAKTFKPIGATRTTVSISALPTPIAVEFKVIARIPE